MPTFIYSHNFNSEGANLLRDAMGIRKIRHENSRFRGAASKRVINWGSSNLPAEILRCQVLNEPGAVGRMANKLSFFQAMARSNVDFLPPWTTNFNDAVAWCGAGHHVAARTVLNGHSGAGIQIMEPGNPNTFVQAPLYTRYIKKEEEYRLHVINNNVIDTQRKVLSSEKKQRAADGEEVNWKIRNLANGFIYQRENVNPNQRVVDAALAAMRESGLYFGAVDVIWNTREQRAYVLEINTAPGITGTTVQNYARALR